MIMSSIKKRPACPFDLLGFAIFVSAIASALLSLLSKVLVTRLSDLDITAKSLEKIKRLSTGTPSDQTPWLLEKALVYQIRPKNLITTYSIRQEACLLCCFFAVLAIFGIQIKPVYQNHSLRKSHKPGYFYNIIPRRA